MSWGWITPGTGSDLRRRQEEEFLKFWRRWGRQCRFSFTHCGWYLDTAMPEALRELTEGNPDVERRSRPVSAALARLWRQALREGRLEFILYPYAGCIAGAMEGETLLRSLRYSLEAARRTLGERVGAGVLVHDACYGLDWGTEQLPQMARLLGIRWIVAGRSGLIEALDGSTMPCLGSGRTTVGAIREFALRDPKDRTPQPLILEMHDHLHFLESLFKGNHHLLRCQPLVLRSYQLGESLQRPTLRYPATDLGNKGWFGGLPDALAIEQNVFQAWQSLLALEIRDALTGSKQLSPSQRDILWKAGFVLNDDHILWAAHDYKAHYLPCARKLRAVTERLAGRTARTGKVFNPLSWPRAAVIWPEGKSPDQLQRANVLPGWGQGETQTLERPKKSLLQRTIAITPSCRVDVQGGLSLGGHRAGLQVLEVLPGGQAFSLRNDGTPAAFVGSLALEWDLDLSSCPDATYRYRIESEEIQGDAYLLECEFFDLNGQIRKRVYHPLRSLGWEGGSLPRHVSRIDPVIQEFEYFHRVRLRIYVACEGGIACRNLRAVPLRGNLRAPFEPKSLRVVPQATCKYRPLRLEDGEMRRWAKTASEATFRIAEPGIRGHVLFRGEATSPLIQVSCQMNFSKPEAFPGWPTPPLTPAEGSFLGAGCERPYMPGILFEMETDPHSRFDADRPYFTGPVLSDSTQTWHTDRRDWWMGFSAFSAAQFASATSRDSGSVLLASRGLHHFYRRQSSGKAGLGLSLGSGLQHPCMQGFDLPQESPFFAMLGRGFPKEAIRNARLIQAKGTYHYDFAIGHCKQPWPLSSQWKTAREFACPVLRESPRIPPAKTSGIQITPECVVATACEVIGGKLDIRLLNLEGRTIPAHISVKAGYAHHMTLPPYALRTLSIP